MALIGTIRKQSGLLIIIVGIALAAFVLGDFLKPRSQRRLQNVGEISGEDITATMFNDKVDQAVEIQKQNQKKENLDANEIFSIKEQTWNQMVNDILLNKEYSKLGLVVSGDELFDQVQGEEPHQYILQYFKDPKTNMYDPQLVRNYLKNLDNMDPAAKKQWVVFEKAIKDDRLQTKYKNLLTKAYYMPDRLLKKDFVERRRSARIRLTATRYSTIPDTLVKVTDGDLQKYYEEYKTNYKQEASRDIKYVVFDVLPSDADREDIKVDVMKIYEDFQKAENVELFVNTTSDTRYDSTFFKKGKLAMSIDTLAFTAEAGTFIPPFIDKEVWKMAKVVDIQMRPDSMKASHILVSYQGAAGSGEDMKRTKDQAKTRTDSILNVVKANPAKLEELAKTLSDDPSAKENGGDLKWFADGAMVFPFNNAVYRGKVGDVVKVETVFGYHIIKITGKKDPEKKVRVAIVERKIEPSNETAQSVYGLCSKFAGEVKDLEDFDTIAARYTVNVRVAEYLQPMANRIAGMEFPRQLIRWTFMDGIKLGSISPVFDMDMKYIVAAVTKVREKGIPPLEDLKQNLEPLVRTKKKGDLAVDQINMVLKQTSDMTEIASKLGAKVDTLDQVSFSMRSVGSYGAEFDVIGKALTMQQGVISKPVKGNNAAFVLIVDEIKEADLVDYKTAYKNLLLTNFKSKVNNNSFLTALKETAEISDNRTLYY